MPVTGLATAVFVAVAALVSPAASAAPRDPLVQPFSAASPWNTPIGTGAVYEPAELGTAAVGVEAVLVAPLPATGAPTASAACTGVQGAAWLVLVDARALTATSYHCPGAPAPVALRLEGTGVPAAGARPRSALPAPGGSLTAAELAGTVPVRHALALTVPGSAVPAGTLLALPPWRAVGIAPRTRAGRALLAALRDYGAYVAGTGSTGLRLRVRADLPARGGSTAEAPDAGDGLPTLDAAQRADVGTLLRALAVVANAGPGVPGGPGRRRVPPPPALAPAGAHATATPAPSPARSAGAPSARAVAVAARPVAQVDPRPAPAAALWGVGALAAALLVAGLGTGRRLARGGR